MNLKQLYLAIEDMLLMHPEINSVTRLSVKDYIGDRSKVYTNANVFFVSSSIQGKFVNHTFLITISDRLTPTGHNEIEIINNTQVIAEDLFTKLGNSYDYNFQKNVNIQQFTDADGDRTAGIFFQINIQVLRTQNECLIPSKIKVFPYELPIELL